MYAILLSWADPQGLLYNTVVLYSSVGEGEGDYKNLVQCLKISLVCLRRCTNYVQEYI